MRHLNNNGWEMSKKANGNTKIEDVEKDKSRNLEKELNELIEENETRSEAYMKIIKEINKRINSTEK
ncbi:MAG: hypothetical protein K9G46_11200 [Flavobacteriales bacterium]|nr:hypothetical protein [Flavobacteriales bacterium]